MMIADIPIKCDLLALPSELRLGIYKAFFSGQPRSITYPYGHAVSLVDKQHMQLLLVCKSIYHEALPEYYRTCLFALYTLSAPHLQKMFKDMADTHFTQYATKLLVWKVPEHIIFQSLRDVKWVKLLGITCGVKPDPVTGQLFTHSSLMAALQKSRVPGFSYDRCQDLFHQYPHIDFMVDLRCDNYEIKLDADGHPQRKWIKTNFVYDVRANIFIEDLRGGKRDALILRSQTEHVQKSWNPNRAFVV